MNIVKNNAKIIFEIILIIILMIISEKGVPFGASFFRLREVGRFKIFLQVDTRGSVGSPTSRDVVEAVIVFFAEKRVRGTVLRKNASRGRRDERAPEDSPVDCLRARSASKTVRGTVCEADRSESFLQQTRYGCAWQKVDVTKSVRWTVSARQAVSAMPTTDGAKNVRYGLLLQQTCHRLLCPFFFFSASLTRKAANREKSL